MICSLVVLWVEVSARVLVIGIFLLSSSCMMSSGWGVRCCMVSRGWNVCSFCVYWLKEVGKLGEWMVFIFWVCFRKWRGCFV